MPGADTSGRTPRADAWGGHLGADTSGGCLGNIIKYYLVEYYQILLHIIKYYYILLENIKYYYIISPKHTFEKHPLNRRRRICNLVCEKKPYKPTPCKSLVFFRPL